MAMSGLWRRLARGARALLNRRVADTDVADEVQHYHEQAMAAHVARGLAPAEALRAAHLETGNLTTIREEVRAYGWENVIETLLADLRYAARRLRAAPGFTGITVLTLALGIGATTAIFSVVNPILFQSLPYPDANRIAMIWEIGSDGARIDGTFGMYRGLVERTRSLEAITAFKPWQPTMTGVDQPERLDGQRVSASYFRVLGVSPLLGRNFQPSDDRPGGPTVIIVSDAFWRRRFGADSAIIGRHVTLDDDRYLVVGVMPNDFENVLAPAADVWAPLQYDVTQGRAWGHHLRTVGRLRPGVSVDRASRELTALGQAVLETHRPGTYGEDVALITTGLQDDLTRGVRPALLAILGAAVLVLLIACVNVTNLLLARGTLRQGEFALRAALGASRSRMVRQLLTESVLLAALGGGAGIAVAALGVRTLVALSPPELPRVEFITVDGAAFAFAMAITTLIGLAFGLTPGLQSSAHAELQRQLQQGSQRTVGRHRRARNALVVAEVALALVLLVSSGLLVRSLERLFAVAAGFDASRLLTMQVQTSGHRFTNDSSTHRFFDQALETVLRVPGVTEAAFTSQLPLSGDATLFGVHFDPSPTNDPGEVRGTFRYAVSPGYVETMRIPLRRGRLLDARDRAGSLRVALISESIAKRRLSGIDPLGQRLRIGAPDGPLFTIVGVVGDVKQMSLALNDADAVYTSATQWHFADNVMSLVVRARGDAAALAPAVRAAIWKVDKDQPIMRIAMMDDLLAESAAERRFALLVFEAFALAALALAAAGIYGVLSGSVAERRREIGVRAALGASQSNILTLVVRQGMTLAGLGIIIGVAGAAGASQVIVAMLFGVSPLDPVTYFTVIALLVGVAVIACAVPAWRAARVDPVSTLRGE